jgi:pyridoxal phosphate-dependent aminotransferase EpsN
VTALAAENIEARPVWRPMHTQPMFASAERVGGAVAEQLYQTGICLPSSSSLAPASQDRVIDAMLTLFERDARAGGAVGASSATALSSR